jgi:hypothetical protein
MKMINYSALGALALLLILWAALIFDTGNILHHMSETLHFFEGLVKAN